jgi:hypothetical protein
MTSRSSLLARAVVPLVLVLALAGCGGDDDAGGAGVPADAKRQAAALDANAGTTAAAAEPGSDSGGSGLSPAAAQKACDDIDKAVKAVPSKDPISTQAGLVGVLSELFVPGGALHGRSGSELDDITGEACPDVKAAALEQAQISSFGRL